MAIVKWNEVEGSGATPLTPDQLLVLQPQKMAHCCGAGFVSALGLQTMVLGGDEASDATKRRRLIRVLKHITQNLPEGRRTSVMITTTRGGPTNLEPLNTYLRDLGYKRAVWMSRHGNYPIFMWCLVKKKYEGPHNAD